MDIQLLLTINPTGTGGCKIGMNDASENQFKIYPNPVSKALFIESEGTFESLLLLTVDGRMVDLEKVIYNSKKIRLDLVEGLSDGVYILIIHHQGHHYFEKIVVCKWDQ